MGMKLIFMASPYSGDIAGNAAFAEEICRAIVLMGHAPFAPHLLYPLFLDEDKEVERGLGIECGKRMIMACDEVWIFRKGAPLTRGMQAEVAYAKSIGKPVLDKVAIYGQGETKIFDVGVSYEEIQAKLSEVKAKLGVK